MDSRVSLSLVVYLYASVGTRIWTIFSKCCKSPFLLFTPNSQHVKQTLCYFGRYLHCINSYCRFDKLENIFFLWKNSESTGPCINKKALFIFTLQWEYSGWLVKGAQNTRLLNVLCASSEISGLIECEGTRWKIMEAIVYSGWRAGK